MHSVEAVDAHQNATLSFTSEGHNLSTLFEDQFLILATFRVLRASRSLDDLWKYTNRLNANG